MPLTLHSLGIDRLTLEERLDLVEQIWDDIAANPQQLPVSDAVKQELDRRLADYESDPDNVIPWETVRDEALARLRR